MLLSDDENGEKSGSDEEDDEYSRSSNSQSLNIFSSTGNQLFKKGQQLINQSKTGQKRTLDDESANSAVGSEISSFLLNSKKLNQANNSENQKSKSTESGSLLNKFSFLNKDKSYMNRLSTYVNKTIVQTDQVTSVTASSKLSTRNNNMVFTSRFKNSEEAENEIENKTEPDNSYKKNKFSKINQNLAGLKSSSIDSSSIKSDHAEEHTVVSKPAVPEAKRIKIDTSESIFNHL